MSNKFKYNKNHKASKLAGAITLALPLSLLSVGSANAAFPTFEDEEKYYNHVASSVPGKNLIVNPSLSIANCDEYEDAVKAAVSVACTGTDGKLWSWTEDLTSASGGKDNGEHYAPPGATVDIAKLGKLGKNKTAKLSEAIAVQGVSEIYVEFYLLHNDLNGDEGAKSEVNLVLDGAVIPITEYTVHNTKDFTAWAYTVDANDGLTLVDGKYTGSVNVEFINSNTNKTLFDNVFLSTDVVIPPAFINTPPVISGAANVTVPSSSLDSALITDTSIVDFLAAVSASDVDDGTLTVTNDAPDVFPLSDTVVTFTVTDNNGSTVTEQATVTVVDTAPVMTLNGNASVFTQQNITYEDQGATAVDNVDGDITENIVTTGTVDTATLGTYTITYTVSDGVNPDVVKTRTVNVGGLDTDGDGVSDDDDDFKLDAAASVDTDGDGFPDAWNENKSADDSTTGLSLDTDIDGDGVLNENDADPFVAVAQADDLDRDGVHDDVDTDGVNITDAATALEAAILANGAISLDATDIDTDIIPVVTAFVSQVLADANVTDVAIDAISGDAIRRSGSHELMVDLINTVGSLTSFDLVLNITPNVTIPQTVWVKADEEIAINLTLSGDAISYPVTFDYRFERIVDETVVEADENAEADLDANLIEAGALSIESGQAHMLKLPGQMDGGYQVVFSEGIDRNAAIVGNAVTVINAVENIAPALDFALRNDDSVVTVLDQTATDAEIAITITDVDMFTEHNVVVTLNGEEVFTAINDINNPVILVPLDIATLGAGEHELQVVITEIATDELYSTPLTIPLTILAALPVLEDTIQVELEDGSFEDVIVDTDGDGISDAEEGFGDSDSDGIADYLDGTNGVNEQTLSVAVVTTDDNGEEVVTIEETSITVEDGLTIAIGDTLKALESGLSADIGAEVSVENYAEVLQVTNDAKAVVEASLEDVRGFLIPLVDFKIKGVDAGATVNMNIKLPTALPKKSAYRKVQDDGTLVDFDTTNGDSIMSAMSDNQGDCPAADSADWQAGLVKGNDCVKVAIADGGPNDADGRVNGVIVDPAVLVEVKTAPATTVSADLSTIKSGDLVTLTASSANPEGDELTYTWVETSGADITLTGADSKVATFTAPNANATLTFELTVSGPFEPTTTSLSVDVTKANNDSGGSLGTSALLLLAGLIGLRRRVKRS
ncbi:DUF5011 domain-containing protein [Thalassotalea psychrophila]|uniref:DUF5011 domain-containing protein n=1 Tax=Thalassotalea psychrophila TaxID=3065647 RepID=A0ABY9TWY5_9GAMM|nr:DUF5011 domain-containing protein [Colwelliaceae bacterium SQ149]